MATQFSKQGSSFRPVSDANMQLHSKLPAGNFRICVTPSGQFYFESMDSFSLPPKLYGETNAHAQRILRTFDSREGTTGVLLTGEKGSGKSLLAKKLSIEAAALGMPTLVINTPFTGEDFNALLQSLEQPAVVLLDEFEKVYDARKQQEMLTLLDGTMASKKLFVLTCNDKYRVDSYMRNRPGRIFYMLDYEGLSKEFIQEYCDDNGLNNEQGSGVQTVASMFSAFNFDMLKALIEEMKRYNESAMQAVKMMNMKPAYDDEGVYTVEVTRGKTRMKIMYGVSEFKGSPVAVDEFTLELMTIKPEVAAVPVSDPLLAEIDCDDDDDDEENGKRHRLTLNPENLKGMDRTTGVWRFEKDGFVVNMRRKPRVYTDMAALAY